MCRQCVPQLGRFLSSQPASETKVKDFYGSMSFINCCHPCCWVQTQLDFNPCFYIAVAGHAIESVLTSVNGNGFLWAELFTSDDDTRQPTDTRLNCLQPRAETYTTLPKLLYLTNICPLRLFHRPLVSISSLSIEGFCPGLCTTCRKLVLMLSFSCRPSRMTKLWFKSV
jgi:hypothetical protein